MEEILFRIAEVINVIQEPLVGILTMYVMMLLKSVQKWVANLRAVWQQIIVALFAYGITQLGFFLNLILPENISAWDTSAVSASISAAIAYGVHAGKRLKERVPKQE